MKREELKKLNTNLSELDLEEVEDIVILRKGVTNREILEYLFPGKSIIWIMEHSEPLWLRSKYERRYKK